MESVRMVLMDNIIHGFRGGVNGDAGIGDTDSSSVALAPGKAAVPSQDEALL
jgi:hypothetical protein